MASLSFSQGDLLFKAFNALQGPVLAGLTERHLLEATTLQSYLARRSGSCRGSMRREWFYNMEPSVVSGGWMSRALLLLPAIGVADTNKATPRNLQGQNPFPICTDITTPVAETPVHRWHDPRHASSAQPPSQFHVQHCHRHFPPVLFTIRSTNQSS